KLTRETTPEKIERDLMTLVPKKDWTIFSHLLILHGRKTCIARRPKCENCGISELCPSSRI
ncbi:MAG TPA: endonuclease III, partial [Gemmatimonadales bacterium]|nr:endonuclease III [Gemmatimonadales bacterium]